MIIAKLLWEITTLSYLLFSVMWGGGETLPPQGLQLMMGDEARGWCPKNKQPFYRRITGMQMIFPDKWCLSHLVGVFQEPWVSVWSRTHWIRAWKWRSMLFPADCLGQQGPALNFEAKITITSLLNIQVKNIFKPYDVKKRCNDTIWCMTTDVCILHVHFCC